MVPTKIRYLCFYVVCSYVYVVCSENQHKIILGNINENVKVRIKILSIAIPKLLVQMIWNLISGHKF